MNDDRPWVIGYSGGKDSTLTTMFVLEAIAELPKDQRNKEIHIVSSDTMVENPLILNYLDSNINAMRNLSSDKKYKLNIHAKLEQPLVSESFWSLFNWKRIPYTTSKSLDGVLID